LQLPAVFLALVIIICSTVNPVVFLLGDTPAPEFYVLPFRNTLSVCSETAAHKIQAPGNHPKEILQD